MGPCKSKIKNEKSCDTLQICFLILDLKGGKSIDECYTINESKCKIGKNKFKDICGAYCNQCKWGNEKCYNCSDYSNIIS